MTINAGDYPPGFAEYAGRVLDARLRVLRMLSTHEKLVCRCILEAFPRLGRGPAFEEVVEETGLTGDEVETCLARLDEIDMLKYDDEAGRMLVLYPLSDVPCPHRVHISGKKPVYAM